MEENLLVNRVDQSGIVTIDLEKYYPGRAVMSFDLKDHLFQGLILREKDFRETLKNIDWQKYSDAVLCVYCSSDAIIPVWAYMLVSASAAPVAYEVFTGTPQEWLQKHYSSVISGLDINQFTDKRIVIKGCSEKAVPHSAYAEMTARLLPVALSVMYGEPCSTVPVYKKAKVS